MTRAIAAAIVSALVIVTSAESQTLRWGGDAEGGAPFVEADPRDPTRLVGFDVEIAELVARKLGLYAAVPAGAVHLARPIGEAR